MSLPSNDAIYAAAFVTAGEYVMHFDPRQPEDMAHVLAVLMQECAKGLVVSVGTDEALVLVDKVRQNVAERMERKPHWFDRPDQKGTPPANDPQVPE